MNYLSTYIHPVLLNGLGKKEIDYLKKIFIRFKGLPNLEELWQLMDETWMEIGCNPKKMDHRIEKFYKHPVWIINGLFSETDYQSVQFRKTFTKWIKEQHPKRVADFGGGFGTLASLIGKELPNTQIEIIDPHPNPAVKKYRSFKNVKFAKRFTGKYDLIIATDVFEHLSDPITDLKKTGKYLHKGGWYLIANLFEPVIKCHLPQHFHLRATWDYIMKAMGYEIGEKVAYGRAYRLITKSNEFLARKISKRGKKIDLLIKSFPTKQFGRLNNILNRLYNVICYCLFR